MNHFQKIFLAIVLGVGALMAQAVVPIGAGSYASYPPEHEAVYDWDGNLEYTYQSFANGNEGINILPGETRPIPSSDWWTDLLVTDGLGGQLWAYPIMLDPDASGMRVYYPNSLVAQRNDVNIDIGTFLQVGFDAWTDETKADNTTVLDWDDLGLKARLSGDGNQLDYRLIHGSPFAWFEVSGEDPIISGEAGGSIFLPDGSVPVFPYTGDKVVFSSGGKNYGIHVPDGTTFEFEGFEYLQVDLESTFSIDTVEIEWGGHRRLRKCF